MPLRNINYALTAIVICLGLWSIVAAYRAMDSQVSNNSAPKPTQIVLESKEFQSWMYECLQNDEGAQEPCTVSQNIVDEGGVSVLRAEIYLIDRGGEILPRLQVTAPLGTFLPLGLSVHLAPQEPFTVPFQFCNKEGCFINLDLADDVVQMLKQSQALDISYRHENRELMKHSIGLIGFYDALSYLIARS